MHYTKSSNDMTKLEFINDIFLYMHMYILIIHAYVYSNKFYLECPNIEILI